MTVKAGAAALRVVAEATREGSALFAGEDRLKDGDDVLLLSRTGDLPGGRGSHGLKNLGVLAKGQPRFII